MKFYPVFALILLTLSACNSLNLTDVTVSITNLRGNSGGTGTILLSSSTNSLVLTNAHVCEVVKNGGIVHKENGNKFAVQSFRQSQLHDLCIISVPGDLKGNVKIASRPPFLLEGSVVSGHPRLLPIITSLGHFSGKEVIQVMVGLRDCTEEEKSDPKTIMFCAFVGKLPIVKSYESQVVSNLIQPGSSGSAVYNSDGELSSVIFAGSGDIGYGFAVPYEYVSEFMRSEVFNLQTQYPDLVVKFSNTDGSKREYKTKVKELCDKEANADNELCGLMNTVLVLE